MTSKSDTKEHGIGLDSVKRMVDEMNGMLDLRWKKDIFCVNVMFYLQDIELQN